MLKSDVEKKLADKNLLSNDDSMTKLVVDVDYTRHFVGDATPISSDFLTYPNMNYTIKVYDGENLLTTIKKKDMTYQGGFAMNMQVIAGRLRDKKYELDFIDALANEIVDNIEEMRNR